jgi:drug/metabolite transporter (DMT)-like permease
MNATLQQHLEICFRRTTQSLRWIGLICIAVFAIVFLVAVYSIFSAPKMDSGMFVGLAVIAAFMAGSYAVYAHAERIQKRLHHVFFVAPGQVVRIDAKVFQTGPIMSYMFHFHSQKPAKVVGISVPNQASFDALRTLLPQHFPNATYK